VPEPHSARNPPSNDQGRALSGPRALGQLAMVCSRPPAGGPIHHRVQRLGSGHLQFRGGPFERPVASPPPRLCGVYREHRSGGHQHHATRPPRPASGPAAHLVRASSLAPSRVEAMAPVTNPPTQPAPPPAACLYGRRIVGPGSGRAPKLREIVLLPKSRPRGAADAGNGRMSASLTRANSCRPRAFSKVRRFLCVEGLGQARVGA